MTTIKEITSLIKDQLSPLVGDNEARHFIWLLFDYLRSYSPTDIILKEQEVLDTTEIAFINEALGRLMKGEPIQYVLGQTEFMGLSFKVDTRVLIPRPETEELVEWILSEVKNERVNVLDIGTGSGCIPIAIKKNLTKAKVVAWDVSVDALNVSKENAVINKVDVDFIEEDVFNPKIINQAYFDIVVSNPPYVTNKEKAMMAGNVLDNEPHLALFVSDDEPLVFYRAIACLSKNILKPGGKLYFEINQAYGKEVVEMLNSECFVNIILRKDLSGRDRMVRAIWPAAQKMDRN